MPTRKISCDKALVENDGAFRYFHYWQGSWLDDFFLVLSQFETVMFASKGMEERMRTSDRVMVTVDLRKVAMNLRTTDGNIAGEGSARAFMSYAGFDSAGDGKWVGPRAGLRRFNPGEVIGVEPLAD